MGRAKIPVEVIQARGNFHIGKNEIAERKARELKPLEGDIIAPAYLTKKQKEEFYKIADQLQRLKIMGETDIEALARYVVANEILIKATKALRRKDVNSDLELFDKWTRLYERYFKIVRASATDLGLTISSRCKLVVPGANNADPPKINKFSKFEKVRVANE